MVGTNDWSRLVIQYMYKNGGMKWDILMWGSLGQTFYPARIGFIMNLPEDVAGAELYEYPASGLKINSAVSLKPKAMKPMIYLHHAGAVSECSYNVHVFTINIYLNFHISILIHKIFFQIYM